MNDTVTSHPLDLLHSYALDALSPQELARLEEHLERCSPCRDEADELRAIASTLAPSSTAAPPALRARIVSAIHRS